MSVPPSRGLPPRIYVPILAIVAIAFLATMAYLVAVGFGVTGSVFGTAAKTGAGTGAQQGTQAAVEGGPPPAVMEELKTLRERIAAHPNDDVALTQLGDMYLAANRFSEAIPLYRRALRANPRNVAAQAGLSEARDALQSSPQ
ncbi:MAG TPA: tetratricopeptide repeat protein [Candidatus Tumulicola sp.]